MKKLIIALLLVPGYVLSMRAGAPTTNRQSQKNVETLRREFYDLQAAAAEAQQFPEQAQARLNLVGKRLAELTNDIARSKTQAIRQGVRSQIQTRRQGTPDHAQSNTMQEYQMLEQELQKFVSNLNTMIVRTAKTSSRSYARARQGRPDKQQDQYGRSKLIAAQPAVRTTTRANRVAPAQQNKMRASATSSAKTEATPPVYTIDYTKE